MVAAITGTRTGLAFQGREVLKGSKVLVSQAAAREGHISFHCHKSKCLGLQVGVAGKCCSRWEWVVSA